MDGRRLTVLQMLPALESGGVEQGTLEVGKALVAQGHRSLVISTGGRMVSQLESEGSEHLRWGISKGDHLFALRYIWKLRDLLRREQVDILHVRSRHPAWVAWLAWSGMPRVTRPRFITTAHGLYSPGRYSSVMARGERVIAISETVREHLLKQFQPYVSDSAIQVIYRGVDEDCFESDYEPGSSWIDHWFKQFPHLQGRPLMTLPGRLTRLKGHTAFIEIVQQVAQTVPEVQGVIVGGAHPRKQRYADELRQIVRRRGIKNITFTGQRSDMREILSISDVVLSLSSAPPEAFGRTVVEALSLGTPVVGFDHGGAGEILAALFPDGAIPPGAIESASERVIQFLQQSPPKIRPNRVFTLRKMVSQTLELYRDVA